MSPETGSLLLLLLFCAGATAVNHLTTEEPTEDKEALGILFPRVKPGRCPADVNSPGDASTLEKECKRDGDCKGKKKCCFSGGRRRCLLPLDVKENACPYFDDSVCITTKFVPLCKSDDQCQGTERCCYYGCRLQCTPTVKAKKSGLCPYVKEPNTVGLFKCLPVNDTVCKNDEDCEGEKKCCSKYCINRCQDPVYGQIPIWNLLNPLRCVSFKNGLNVAISKIV